jgi:cellulose synthase/poly-beta-1,6-N-acetylglucosamine synthase-like glycosyltransferase
VVIPTRDRTPVLHRTLKSLASQSVQPAELIIVDASTDESTRSLCVEETVAHLLSTVSWCRAESVGAASQRNQGVRDCSHPVIGFMDDDILFEPECFRRLWSALQSDDRIGGVSSMITNQRYQSPGRISQLVFWLMAGQEERSYAGRVLGPAVNLLPEDREDLPEIVPVEWLNTTCTLYRREALPDPPFLDHFTEYSLMEDLALSLIVGRSWALANARTARIRHDSQPGTHKSDHSQLAEMQLVNRHFVMTRILGRDRLTDYLKLGIFELFSLASSLQSRTGRATLLQSVAGRLRALRRILTC